MAAMARQSKRCITVSIRADVDKYRLTGHQTTDNGPLALQPLPIAASSPLSREATTCTLSARS